MSIGPGSRVGSYTVSGSLGQGGVAAGDATQSMTAAGVIVGTPQYMSPEQVRGEPVDTRSDVWAFGCVLYETLTGRRAFQGESVPETLAAVLGSEPDWTSLPATVPPHVRTLLRRCLARDRRRRVKHMSTVRLVLEEEDALVARAELAPRSARSRAWITVALALAAAGAGFAAGSWFYRSGPPAVVRSSIQAEMSATGTDLEFAFLPDGRLAYVSRDTREILVRPMDALDAVPILTTASYLRGVFPSPDNRWIAFVENAFTLKKVAAGGGAAVPIVQMDGPPRGATWGPDDTIVFATANATTGLQQVSASGGAVSVTRGCR